MNTLSLTIPPAWNDAQAFTRIATALTAYLSGTQPVRIPRSAPDRIFYLNPEKTIGIQKSKGGLQLVYPDKEMEGMTPTEIRNRAIAARELMTTIVNARQTAVIMKAVGYSEEIELPEGMTPEEASQLFHLWYFSTVERKDNELAAPHRVSGKPLTFVIDRMENPRLKLVLKSKAKRTWELRCESSIAFKEAHAFAATFFRMMYGQLVDA